MKYNFKSLLNSFNGVLIEGTNFTNAQEILDNLKNNQLRINGLSTVKFFASSSFNLQTFTNALQSFIDSMKQFNPSTVGDAVKLLFMKSDAESFINNAKPDPYIAYFKYKNVRDKPENIKALFDLFPKKNNDDHSFEKKVLEFYDNSSKAKMSQSDVETFYNGNGWKVFSPKTYGAAQKLSWLNGKKIPWCTAADPGHFQQYTKIGKLICFINDKRDLAFQFNGTEKVMDKNDKFFEEVNMKDKNDEPRNKPTTLNQIETVFSSIPQEVLVKIFGNKVYGNWQMLLKNKNKPKSAISLKPVEERNGFKRFVVKTNEDINKILSQFFDIDTKYRDFNKIKFGSGESEISKNFFSKQLGIKDFKENDQLWVGKYENDNIIAFSSKGKFDIYSVSENPFQLYTIVSQEKSVSKNPFRSYSVIPQEKIDKIKSLLVKKDGGIRGKEDDKYPKEKLKNGTLSFDKHTYTFKYTFDKATEMKTPRNEKISYFKFKDYNTSSNDNGTEIYAHTTNYNKNIIITFFDEEAKPTKAHDFEEFKKLNSEIWQELKTSKLIKKYWIGTYLNGLKEKRQKGDVQIYKTIKEEILEMYKSVLI